MDINDYEKNFKPGLQKEIDSIMERSKTEELNAIDYYTLWSNYKLLQNKSEYEAEIEKYKNKFKDIMLNCPTRHTAEEYSCLGHVYFEEKLYDKCFDSIDNAIRLEPRNYNYYLEKGELYRKMGKNKLAEIEYAKAIEIDPNLKKIIQTLKDVDKTISGGKHIWIILFLVWGLAIAMIVYSIFLAIE